MGVQAVDGRVQAVAGFAPGPSDGSLTRHIKDWVHERRPGGKVAGGGQHVCGARVWSTCVEHVCGARVWSTCVEIV